MNSRVWLVLVGLGLSLSALSGCAAKGETVQLDLRTSVRGDGAPLEGGERVQIEAFEDLRAEQGPLGVRTHIWGGVTRFDVPGGKPGAVLARLLGETLLQKGRQVKVVVAGSGKAEAPADGAPDVTITGQIQEFSTHAKSRFGSTVITAKLQVLVLARNSANGSTVRLMLEDARSRTVFWFEPEDVQDLVNAMLADGLEKLLSNVRVDGRSWALKS